MVGIISAISVEIENLKTIIDIESTEFIGGVEFYKGKISNTEVVAAKCGVGLVAASICAEAMILQYHPEYIINVGIGGAINKTLHIGDLVIADSVVQHDMDTTSIGDPLGYLSDLETVEIKAEVSLSQKMKLAAEEEGLNCVVGGISSGDRFIASIEEKKHIEDNFGSYACEMEGAAIGHVCCVNKVPFTVVRAISDSASDEAEVEYFKFCEIASKNSAKVIKRFIENTQE